MIYQHLSRELDFSEGIIREMLPLITKDEKIGREGGLYISVHFRSFNDYDLNFQNKVIGASNIPCGKNVQTTAIRSYLNEEKTNYDEALCKSNTDTKQELVKLLNIPRDLISLLNPRVRSNYQDWYFPEYSEYTSEEKIQIISLSNIPQGVIKVPISKRYLLNINTNNNRKQMTLHDLCHAEFDCNIDLIKQSKLYEDISELPKKGLSYTNCQYCIKK